LDFGSIALLVAGGDVVWGDRESLQILKNHSGIIHLTKETGFFTKSMEFNEVFRKKPGF
jgi:hypothetical protein